MKRRLALLALALLALPGWGAGPLEAWRAESQAAREQVTALRGAQLRQRNDLSALSARIEVLKAETKGKLLRGSELDGALKRSQEMSASLSELSRQVSLGEAAQESVNMGLLDALSSELGRLRAEFDRQGDRSKRQELIELMRRLRTERDALRQTLPASTRPSIDAVKPSDDPEELLEQVDLLKDTEEKLARELKVVEARIAERKDEADLDRHVQRFMGEESMFDDGDRRLKLQQTSGRVAATGLAETANASSPGTSRTAGTGVAPSADSFSLGGASPQAAAGPPGAQSDTAGPANPPTAPKVSVGTDARVQVGSTRSVGASPDGIEGLEAERARLTSLVAQLKQKAQALQKRASELK